MAHNVKKSKGRAKCRSFVMLRHDIMQHENFYTMPFPAIKLLIDLLSQFKGHNNGDLTATWSVMQKRGWKSRDTLEKALRELIERGWIMKTRQGGKHKCNLFAVTWEPIDDCNGKTEIPATRTAPDTWKN